jgi:hypothetical protein
MNPDPRAEAERRWPDYPHIGFSGPSDRQAAFIEGVEWARTVAAEHDRQVAAKLAAAKRELRAHAARLREEQQ